MERTASRADWHNNDLPLKESYHAVRDLAAAQGFAPAQYSLGIWYKQGYGVPQDFAEAEKLLKQSAQQGFSNAQMELAEMYEEGNGVAQDFVQAHFWFNIVGANAPFESERTRAREARDEIAQKMTGEQIATAQRLAREWKPSP